MSIVNGRSALLAPPVMFAFWSLLEDVGITPWVLALLKHLPQPVLGAAAILGFVVVGTLATITRYQGFSARLTADNTLLLTYGLVEKRERQVDLASIEGITVRRSLVEQLLRRSRLSVLAVSGTDDLGASQVLPSLPDSVVRKITRQHFPGFVQDAPMLPDRPAPIFPQLLRVISLYALPVTLLVLMLALRVNIAVAVAASLGVLGITTSIGRLLVLGISVDSHDILKIERPLITEMETYVRARSCHSVWSIHLGESRRPLCFSIRLYAGGPRTFAGTHCSGESKLRLLGVIAHDKEPTARRQRSLGEVDAGSATNRPIPESRETEMKT